MEQETTKTRIIISILWRTPSCYPVTQERRCSWGSSELILVVISLLYPQGHTSGTLLSLSTTLRTDPITLILVHICVKEWLVYVGVFAISASVSSDTKAAQAAPWSRFRQQKAGSVNSPEI